MQSDTSDSPARRGADIRTFLFADVRGYTRYTHEHGDEAASALAMRFADIVGVVVPGFEGELLELRGDEALCVFSSARQALRAAVELQRRFRERVDGEPVLPVGVGMGLDAGEAVPTKGGYRGGALNVASRLCALAAAGEVLATETVVALARRVDGLRFQPRRAVRVKGVADPVRLVQVVPEDPLPPLAAPPTSRPDAQRRGRREMSIALGAIVALVAVSAVVVGAILRLGSGSSLRLLADTAGAIDAHGSSLAVRSPVGALPQAISAGDGGVWVANSGDGTVSRLNPSTGSVVDTIPVGGQPTGIAAGAGGVWVVDAANSRVALISPTSGDPVAFTKRVGNGAEAIAVGGRSVWVANSFDGTVSRLASQDGHLLKTIPLAVTPTAIAYGAGGVWVASQTAGAVIHLDSSGQIVSQRSVGSSPVGIAASSNAVWVADSQDGTLWKIDPASDKTAPFVHLGGHPTAVAAFDGQVWVAENGGWLKAVDPHTGHVTSVGVGGVPDALAPGHGRLWMASLPPATTHRGGTLNVLEDTCTPCALGHVSSLDPDATSSTNELGIVIDVYDGLVGYRRVAGVAGSQLVPDLAQSLPTVSSDRETLTFRLRPGIRYSDGTPVRPGDFRRAIERAFKLQNALITTTGYYNNIVGADKCVANPKTCNLDNGITTDAQTGTVSFHLTKPDPTFVYKLALTTADAVPPSAPSHDSGVHPFAGTGPYMIRRFEPEKRRLVRGNWRHLASGVVVLVRNPHFRQWSGDAQPVGYPDKIVVHLGADRHMWSNYLHGAYDVLVGQTPGRQIGRVLRRTPNLVHATASGDISYLILNTQKPPFSSVLARQAINDATNRHQAVDAWLGAPESIITCQIIPPGFPGYTPYCPYTTNPAAGVYHGPNLAAARRLIHRSGVAGDRVYLQYGSPVSYGVIDYFVSVLNRLGLRAAAKTPAWHGMVNGGVIGWGADWPSPSNFFGPLLGCGAPFNPGGYCNHHVDALVARGEQLDVTDPSAARNLWERLDRYVTNQSPLVVIASGRQFDVTSARTGNYQYNPHYQPLLDQMWVK